MANINKRDKKHNYPKRLKTFPEDFSIASSSSAPGVTREELAENGFIYIDEKSIECEYCKFKIIVSKVKDPIKGNCSKIIYEISIKCVSKSENVSFLYSPLSRQLVMKIFLILCIYLVLKTLLLFLGQYFSNDL